MPRRPSITQSALLAGSASLLLLSTACGSHATHAASAASHSAGAPTASGGSTGGKKTCAVAPASLISGTLGLHVGDPAEQDNQSVTVCTYSGASTVILRFDTATDATSFAIEKQGFTPQGMKTTDIDGFGDEAYSATLSAAGITTNTVVVRQGSAEVLISSKATIDEEKSLAQKLLTVL